MTYTKFSGAKKNLIVKYNQEMRTILRKFECRDSDAHFSPKSSENSTMKFVRIYQSFTRLCDW